MSTVDYTLREAIDAVGITKIRAAREIGISRQYLANIVCGKQEPTRPVIQRFLSFLNRPENLKKLGRRKPFVFEELFGDRHVDLRAAS